MKSRLFLLFVITGMFASLPGEEYRQWNMITGGHFEAKLVDVGTTTVKLANREGKTIDFPLADLKPSDQSYAREWGQSAGSSKVAGSGSAGAMSDFAKTVYKDLVRVENGRLKRYRPEGVESPRYFAFYRSAHWCPPCRKFTPKLVEFYDEQKSSGAPFELVFMSRDRDEDAMEGYMTEYGMNWPAFDFGENGDLIALNGTGIPNLIVTDANGKKLLDSYDENGNYRGPTAVMRELKKLLGD